MKDDEPPPEDTPPMKEIRDWRSRERKKTVEAIDVLIEQAVKHAGSKWTQSRARLTWTRVAGQLLWYKDQIMRGMTWEALDRDYDDLWRKVVESNRNSLRPVSQLINPALSLPAKVGKKGEDAAD